MNTKEELLKIFSAYLPYELELNIENEIETEYTMFLGEMDSIMPGNIILSGITKQTSYMPECILYSRNDGEADGYIQIKNAKPILYSMDYLTKEIEHKGERIIPADFIFGKNHNIREVIDEYIINKKGYSFTAIKLPYMQVKKLLELHFNVFNLDESEYIQKKSVIQK